MKLIKYMDKMITYCNFLMFSNKYTLHAEHEHAHSTSSFASTHSRFFLLIKKTLCQMKISSFFRITIPSSQLSRIMLHAHHTLLIARLDKRIEQFRIQISKMNSSFFDASAAAANNTTDEAQDMFEDFSEEVRNIINEMGYDVEEDVLHEIEKDLRLLEENADVADRKLFSCLLDNFDGFPTSASDLDLSLQNLTNMVATSSQQAGQSEIPREFDELITHGYERLQEVYMDIKRYERLLEEGQTGPGTRRNRQREDAQDENVEEDEDDSLPSSQQELARKQRQQPREKEKENVRFVDEEPVKIDPKKEKQLINRFLRANALRATKCPEPGRLPFKHDHQLRLEQYRREWAKLPPPGEQKRMALRWRIRELMLQREIPHLRLISEDAIQVEVEEQPPVVKMTRKSHWKP